jgi:signal transduction histidine kinase
MTKQSNRTTTTILVIDDEEGILNLVEVILCKRGYTVVTANNAAEGVELVATLKPQLVILDYMMPTMDGLEVLSRIKADFPDTYVIMFTGKGSEEIAVELMKAGASDYMRKPFNNQNLLERVENVLRIRAVEIKNRELIHEREQLLNEIKSWNEELEHRIRLESEALRRAHAEVVQSQKLATLGYLAAGMAHEIRNPLNSITLFVQLIKEGVEESEKIDYVEKILKEVDRVDATLSKLMDSAKRSRFELIDVNIGEIIQKALDSFTPQITAQAITPTFSAKRKLPRFKADPAEIEQIFTNLFLNSIDEMAAGGELTIDLDHDDRDLIITVSDSGRGIPAEHIPNIFDPFFSTKARGTGMGLPIVLRIVKNYGGKIEVIARKKSGATFLIRLPVSS